MAQLVRARLQLLRGSTRLCFAAARCYSNGGAGPGDHDTSGSIRGAGGSFAKKEKAIEDQYFHNLEQQQMEKLREHYHEEISHHEEAMKELQEQIEWHKEKIQRHKARIDEHS